MRAALDWSRALLWVREYADDQLHSSDEADVTKRRQPPTFLWSWPNSWPAGPGGRACSRSGAGPFLYTLTLVDVATGWVSCAGLRDKRAQTVLAALRMLQEGLPFRILGLDSDSGSEFLNAPLVEYCAAQRITFTRGRPYRKNDSCFVELCGYPHNSTHA
jgi:hypothetical protein